MPWIYNNSDYPNLVQIVFTGLLKTIGMDLLKLQYFLDGQNKHYFQEPENGFNANQEAFWKLIAFSKKIAAIFKSVYNSKIYFFITICATALGKKIFRKYELTQTCKQAY